MTQPSSPVRQSDQLQLQLEEGRRLAETSKTTKTRCTKWPKRIQHILNLAQVEVEEDLPPMWHCLANARDRDARGSRAMHINLQIPPPSIFAGSLEYDKNLKILAQWWSLSVQDQHCEYEALSHSDRIMFYYII